MDYISYRKTAVKYWELRRIIWNLLVAIFSVFSYWMASGVAAGIGDAPVFGLEMVLINFIICGILANILYSFVYAVEFIFAFGIHNSSYLLLGRKILFILGCILGVILSLMGGRAIALLQYPL